MVKELTNIYQTKSSKFIILTLFYLLDACFDEEGSDSDASTDDNQYLDENEIDDNESCWDKLEDDEEEEEKHRSIILFKFVRRV